MMLMYFVQRKKVIQPIAGIILPTIQAGILTVCGNLMKIKITDMPTFQKTDIQECIPAETEQRQILIS